MCILIFDVNVAWNNSTHNILIIGEISWGAYTYQTHFTDVKIDVTVLRQHRSLKCPDSVTHVIFIHVIKDGDS